MGFADRRIARTARAAEELTIAKRRREFGITPVFKTVDTCGAEFQAFTPVSYSTYEGEDEADARRSRRKMMILGGGPNRIGQGIEFDYCCVHASLALKEAGFETIMVNCNPETVSTDYDISDRLYFEPLTFEDVLAIVEREKPAGRDRAVRRPDAAEARRAAGARRRADSGHVARRDRSRRGSRALQRSWSTSSACASREGVLARGLDEAIAGAAQIGYPVLIRPSYVLGGRAMEIVADEAALRRYVEQALHASERAAAADRPLSRGRDRGRRRCDLRRRDGRHRRHHGAHRARRHPFGRQRLRAAAAHAERRRCRTS